MAKRFTDTKKWGKDFYHRLPLKMKMAWVYLCDNCDHAGVWDVNFSLLSHQVGAKYSVKEFNQYFDGKIVWCGEDKIFIPSFFTFQYADTRDSFSAKISAIKRLKSLGLTDFIEPDCKLNITRVGGESPPSPPSVPPEWGESTSIGIGIGIGIGKKGGVGENKDLDSTLAEIYKIYPRKLGRKEGFARLKKLFATPEDLAPFRQAVVHYADHCASTGTETKFIKHFSSFVSTWEDWLDPHVVESDEPQKLVW